MLHRFYYVFCATCSCRARDLNPENNPPSNNPEQSDFAVRLGQRNLAMRYGPRLFIGEYNAHPRHSESKVGEDIQVRYSRECAKSATHPFQILQAQSPAMPSAEKLTEEEFHSMTPVGLRPLWASVPFKKRDSAIGSQGTFSCQVLGNSWSRITPGKCLVSDA
ncbi:hypothetical protein AN958_12817 [Leucoagaricus sp. SymC.cos]|nr:hypothetical protein AN958_12817 [Leucoagaricus sp. SymC.cos]